MLSAVLRTDIAEKISIEIMNAFVEMSKLLIGYAVLFSRMEIIELKQIEADDRFEEIFMALEGAASCTAKRHFL